jgi:hypothetical protein
MHGMELSRGISATVKLYNASILCFSAKNYFSAAVSFKSCPITRIQDCYSAPCLGTVYPGKRSKLCYQSPPNWIFSGKTAQILLDFKICLKCALEREVLIFKQVVVFKCITLYLIQTNCT